jgi:enediyne biosynthesis protein E4
MSASPFMSTRQRISFLLVTLLILSSCKEEKAVPQNAASNKPPVERVQSFTNRFVNITEQAGIRFVHNNGAFGKKYLPESLGPGCAFFDYDNDNHQDILMINSKDWPEHRTKTSYMALYRNKGNGTFIDVTKKTGLAIEIYGFGVAVGDFDNDHDPDIYVTALDSDHLFENLGNGTFKDITTQAGLADSDLGTSATWFDYDNDGNLDLFVCNYVKWSIEKDLFCTLDGVNKSYCTPESYQGESSRLYRNKGNKTFEDVTEKARLFDNSSKALGVIAFDYDLDGWQDLFVANDTQPNKLYHNERNGKFSEKGVMAGVAFSEAGVARAGMGVDAADYDGSGHLSLLIGNFSNEMLGLYHNEGTGLFIDEAPASTVGQESLLTLTFGAFFFDFDLDDREDIFAANGHVHDDIERVQQQVRYAEPPHLFRNVGNKRFEVATGKVGPDFGKPIVARGAAYGDIDNDGDLDILIMTNGGPPRLLRNDGGRNHYLRFRTVGSKSNKDGIGTRINLHFDDGTRIWKIVKGASGYCSQSEQVVTFGLGSKSTVKSVEVIWPSGKKQQLQNITANQTVILKE